MQLMFNHDKTTLPKAQARVLESKWLFPGTKTAEQKGHFSGKHAVV